MLAESIHSAGRHRQPGAAAARRAPCRAPGRRRRIRSATARRATSGPSSSRWCCSSLGGVFAIFEGVEKLTTPARDRVAGVGVRGARLQHRARVAVVPHRARSRRTRCAGAARGGSSSAARRTPSCRSCCSRTSARSSVSSSRSLGVTLAEVLAPAALRRAGQPRDRRAARRRSRSCSRSRWRAC